MMIQNQTPVVQNREVVSRVAMDQPKRVVPLIAEMMSIPTRSHYAALRLTPQQFKSQALALSLSCCYF